MINCIVKTVEGKHLWLVDTLQSSLVAVVEGYECVYECTKLYVRWSHLGSRERPQKQ